MEINGNHYIDISHEETVMGFAASCVEHVARKVGKDYRTVYEALKRHNAFEDFIVPCYDSLQPISREAEREIVRNIAEAGSEKLEDTILHDISMSGSIGLIAVQIAKELNIEPVRALELFYESYTCEVYHNRESYLYFFGPEAVADEFINEYKQLL